MKSVVLAFLLTGLIACQQKGAQNSSHQRPNILFIAVDDLRPQLGCYGDPVVQSPNLDQLAKSGILFSRAYCQQAVCAPSRASLMTGKRPNTTQVWDLKTHFRSILPDVVTLPQYFRNNGYHAQSIGKIYHDPAQAQDAPSWSAPEILAVTEKEGKYVLAANLLPKNAPKAAASERADVPDEAYIDGQVAGKALEFLRQKHNKPFFLAIGFRRPHLPFSAPQRFWDLYSRENIPLPVQGAPPENRPEYALHNSEELSGYADIGFNKPISQAKARELVHGYYASISYIDAQIGKVLTELNRQNLTRNTIVVLWSDHGFHLGEKGLWAKTTNYELDTRVPLIIAAPGKKKNIRSDALVELVDLYPTLAELSGLAIPQGLEGTSLVSLLTKPNRPWKGAVFSQFPRPWPYQGQPPIMGYAIRTARYRYVEWRSFKTREVKATELYDQQTDPAEMHNLAKSPSHSGLIASLKQQLDAGWQHALPTKPNGSRTAK